MSIASLPMYDFPEVRAATDAWWTALARRLRCMGIADVPQSLLRRDDLIEQWSDPALLVSQICGYLLCNQVRTSLQPVATPHYTAPGCNGPNYASMILVRDTHAARNLEDLRGGIAVYSRTYSHAGYNAFRGIVAPLSGGRRFFSRVMGSGSHVDSIGLIASGVADVATVCCVIYAFVARWRPEALAGTRVLGYTPPALAPPYVASSGATPTRILQLRSGLAAVMADPELASLRDALFLGGLSIVDRTDYDGIAEVERSAIAMNYPELL